MQGGDGHDDCSGNRFLGWAGVKSPLWLWKVACVGWSLSQHPGHLWALSLCPVVPFLFPEAAVSSLNANLPLQHL